MMRFFGQVLSAEQPFEGLDELREVMLDGVPQNVWIDIEVRVNHAVPHRPHHGRRHILVGFLNVFGDMFGGLANNHQVGGHGLKRLCVRSELFKRGAAGERLDFCDGGEDVFDLVAPFPSVMGLTAGA